MSRDLTGVIQVDRFDQRVYGEVFDASKRMQQLADEKGKEIESFPSLQRDLWASLYKSSPEFSEELSPAQRLNQRVMEQLMDMTEYKELHESTKLDEWSSALGSMSLTDQVMDSIPSQFKDLSNQMDDARRELQHLLDQMEIYQDKAKETGDDSYERNIMEIGMDAEQKEDELQQLAQKMDELIDRGGSHMKQSLRKAVQQTSEQMDQTRSQLSTWGAGQGAFKPVPGKERLELAQRLVHDPKLQKISDIAGRMTNIAIQKQKTKTQYPPTEVIDVTMGNNLAHVLPSELVQLRNPMARKDFLRRFAEGKLLQYELVGHEREGKGPILVLCDNTGSMQGQRELWSKAVTMALFAIARHQKRAFACIHFGDVGETQTHRFDRPEKASPSELVDMASFYLDASGTDFETPLREGAKLINESSFNKADIVMVTDGEAQVSDEFLTEFTALKKRKEFNVISVLIDTYNDSYVKPFSDHIAYATMSSDNAETIDLLFSI